MITINPCKYREKGFVNEALPTRHFSGVFLHGKLHDDLLLDLCGIAGDELPKEGVHAVKVESYDEPCTLYYWKSPNTGWNRGLVVADSDEEANEYANRKFKERAQVL